jgi:GNAT superfamily N-acetyltransferase
VTLDFVRLTAPRTPEALAVMQRFYEEESLEFREHRATHALQQLLAHPECGGLWFIELDGTIGGYFVLTACWSLEFGGKYALLDEFFVEPNRRGKGIGAAAMQRIVEESQHMGVQAIRLEVDRRNPRVQAFYQRSGFATEDRNLLTKWLLR